MEQRRIELLAPAKNLACGIEAVNHGADAVYIGAPRFGARAAAGNSIDDIKTLVDYAHLYHVRIYVTVNTILKEEELPDTEAMIWELYRAGVDALIVQDMAVMLMNLPPIALHASTQMDNRTVEKVRFLAEAGMNQVVLPRELTLDEIRAIHTVCPEVALETFVHGALCVSYSGRCYVSQACFARSANRGECAQFCRLPFTLEDAGGNVIAAYKHFLSLRDLNLSSRLEELLDAGVTSLKIEGRLKETSYVKNITAYYREQLDALFKRRKEYVRSSSGTERFFFRPQPDKSFNRGFTHYFLSGRKSDVSSFHTPKSMGEEMGRVKEVYRNYLTVASVKPFHNGDGVCFVDASGALQGFRINKAEENRLYPLEMPNISPRTVLYRNFDQEFEKTLSKKSAERKIGLSVRVGETAWGYTLTGTDEDGHQVTLAFEATKETARSPQTENIRTQLGKLGNTPFYLTDMELDWNDNWFLPSSLLSEWRRQLTERMEQVRRLTYRTSVAPIKKTAHPYPLKELAYTENVMNSQAEAFYRMHGVESIVPAYEKQPQKEVPLMYCKHCIRYSMGWCPVRHKVRSPYSEPFYLVATDGRRFRLEFDCKACQMRVYGE